jgi:hypothetical protein
MPPPDSKCSTCGAAIRWIMVNGRPNPVDLAHKHTVISDDGQRVTGHETHFAHCPHADQHRRGKR